MPRRTDIETILIIGSGPIVIGQACEFDYSGTQACKVLRQLGYRVVLVNSNPATIMTDPEFADATYVEPLSVESLRAVISKERPDALLPTLGGQTGLNLAVALGEAGVLEEFGVELIGASLEAIRTAEDRSLFKAAMEEVGLSVPASGFACSLDEAFKAVESIGLPVIVRPSFVLGGGGTGIAHDPDQFAVLAREGLAASPVSEILIETSVQGWKEYELEVMRDLADNVVVVCSIENLDPMGVHTGDSITVAPALTLSDAEYQEMRDAALRCIRRIGVDTGGSNIQFAVNPENGEMVVIEMNPRVSRSSALASKATGFPIAKIAAQLAVGLRLDEIPNDITKKTPASFEPAIDYVVVKIPRFAFEKFPEVSSVLGTRMRSVGEAMAIGRTFPEALQKAFRSLETGRAGLGADPAEVALADVSSEELMLRIQDPTPDRLFEVAELLRRGGSVDEVAAASGIDPWFCEEIAYVVDVRRRLEAGDDCEQEARRAGFSDVQIEHLTGSPPGAGRPSFKTVDTCAAEFGAATPYFYSTWDGETEAAPTGRPTVVILGSGPNRIGQGIEFDYCCVQAAFALSEAGYDTVMVNCNPETVSTDYDTSTRLYFEPLTLEDVLAIVEVEQPEAVVVQLGGQTPLKLAGPLHAAGVPIAGTSPESIDMAEDRQRFGALCRSLGIPQPRWATATTVEGALEVAAGIGYPLLVRPSYVLGGRAMQIIYEASDLEQYMVKALRASRRRDEAGAGEGRPVLIDRFLEDAIEVDVDALFDGEEVLVGGVMQHIEEAGVHSGDSACVLPPVDISPLALDTIEAHTEALARALEVRGLINIQFAVSKVSGEVYVLEANPRASRTVPFVSKATGVPLAKAAARIMLGATISELREEGVLRPPATGHVAVKEAVLPFARFPGADVMLGPEMRSTGEVMGVASNFGLAFAKSQEAAGTALPRGGTAFLSVNEHDKPGALAVARRFVQLGFELVATEGTAEYLEARGLSAKVVGKVGVGDPDDGRPTALDLIRDGSVQLVLNTPQGRGPRADGAYIRAAALEAGIPCITTLAGGWAAAVGVAAQLRATGPPNSLQEWHRGFSQLRL